MASAARSVLARTAARSARSRAATRGGSAAPQVSNSAAASTAAPNLLQRGAEKDAKDSGGRAPLHIACANCILCTFRGIAPVF